jgi:hypothetical protein
VSSLSLYRLRRAKTDASNLRRVPPRSCYQPTGDLGKLLGAKWKEMDDDEKKVHLWNTPLEPDTPALALTC